MYTVLANLSHIRAVLSFCASVQGTKECECLCGLKLKHNAGNAMPAKRALLSQVHTRAFAHTPLSERVR